MILPVYLELDYDGPSLSETMSYRSQIESFRSRNGSQSSLPGYIKSDLESQSCIGNSCHMALLWPDTRIESIPSRYSRRGCEQPILTATNLSLLVRLMLSHRCRCENNFYSHSAESWLRFKHPFCFRLLTWTTQNLLACVLSTLFLLGPSFYISSAQ